MMSRTLFHRTNKEFDKCAQLLRNILTVQGKQRSPSISLIIHPIHQESRQDSKTPSTRKINRKKTPTSTVSPSKKSSSTKSSKFHLGERTNLLD